MKIMNKWTEYMISNEGQHGKNFMKFTLAQIIEQDIREAALAADKVTIKFSRDEDFLKSVMSQSIENFDVSIANATTIANLAYLALKYRKSVV